jgi:AcrR family transcriptional regulator
VRADARENLDRILAAAARLFAQEGADTSLKAIAKEADVGIATLYRRFPTREDLIEASYRNETERLGRRADELLAANAPDAALRAWMGEFVDYTLTKQGMAEALPAILAAREGLRVQSRDVLRAAIDRILRAAAAGDLLRANVPAEDVMMAIGGVTLIAGHEHQRALADRLLDLLMAGLQRRS